MILDFLMQVVLSSAAIAITIVIWGGIFYMIKTFIRGQYK